MHICFVGMYVWVPHEYSACGSQETLSGPLELELHKNVSSHMDTENGIQVL